MKKFGKMIKGILRIWFFYLIVCLVIPPLYHKRADEENRECERALNMAGQERILNIENNVDALVWRLRLIESAKENIVLATFDFRDDNSGQDMMAALLNAADRGVKVQILVDGINGTLYLRGSRNFRELTSHENVEVKLYNPITLIKPWKNNYRMHDKYLLADDFAYILGGRNTDDLFLGNYIDSYNEDRDILVYEMVPGGGKSYVQLQEYFEKIWNISCCRKYEKHGDIHGKLRGHYQEVRKKYPEAFYETDWLKETIATESIELCTNPMEPENKQPQLWDRMVKEMNEVDNILIQTPYIICNQKMYQDLTEICSRSVKTEIIINAVESGTNPFGCTDYLNQKKNVRQTGSYVYEYLGAQALHTKTILAGDTLSMVGSCNLDMRSVYLDTEMMLFIESGELNESLREQAESLKLASRQVVPDGTITYGEEYRQKEQRAGKMIFYGILRIVIIPFRHLL